MAYARKHGNQISIVHGERDPGTRKVNQRILFSFYSRAEALEAIGKGEDEKNALRFQNRLELQYPRIRFGWKKLSRQIEKNLRVLPEDYPYREARLLKGNLHENLVGLVRGLSIADPQWNDSAAEFIREHRHELGFLVDLIEWRLRCRDSPPNQFTTDNRFYWRFEIQSQGVTQDPWEMATKLYHKHADLDRAEAVFRLLLECFPEEADCHNYLGRIALDRGDTEAAIERFHLAIRDGRRLFPKRISRRRAWRDYHTRPYFRGLCNLADALNVAGRWEEALEICARIDTEWKNNNGTSSSHRSPILLNMGRFEDAAREALRVRQIWPSYSFIAAFASFELGERLDPVAYFLHGALNHPRSARMLVVPGRRTSAPQGYEEVADHNAGVGLLEDIGAYLDRRPRESVKFFRELMKSPQVAGMLQEIEHVRRRWDKQAPTGTREAFDRMNEMKSVKFAEARAKEIVHGIRAP
jgi:tetratricopeptide (TPR) repeat protein